VSLPKITSRLLQYTVDTFIEERTFVIFLKFKMHLCAIENKSLTCNKYFLLVIFIFYSNVYFVFHAGLCTFVRQLTDEEVSQGEGFAGRSSSGRSKAQL